MSTSRVLVVEDDPHQSRLLDRLLRREGFVVVAATTGFEALQLATAEDVTVAIVDLSLPDTSGLPLIGKLQAVRPAMECIVLTGMQSEQAAHDARLAGASDYFEKTSMDVARFVQVVRRACEVHHLRHTIGLLEPDSLATRLLGVSGAMQRLRTLVERMGPTRAPVLVTGESGVGKEVVAEALHEQSRRKGEFVRINCAALPEALVEVELFGAEAGSFTGQLGAKPGLFSIADHGTVFLDEIGEMPLGLQPKLLRVLQSNRYRPIGSRTERELTARVLAATNVDLRSAVRAGTFREDLFYRLAVLTLEVPPLRERKDDVALLASHFVKKFAASEGRGGVTLSADALEMLSARRWSGNVRELSSAILRAVVLTRGSVIGIEDLASDEGAAPVDEARSLGLEGFMDLPLTEAKAAVADAFAREYIQRKLVESGGNVTRAATLAGQQRPNFKREMRRLAIEVDELELGDERRSDGGSPR